MMSGKNAALLGAVLIWGCASPSSEKPAEVRTFAFRVTGMKGQPGKITDD